MNFDIAGRVLVNLWRVVRFELKLTNYDLEYVVWYLFKQKEPKFSNLILSNCYRGDFLSKKIVFDYHYRRIQYVL